MFFWEKLGGKKNTSSTLPKTNMDPQKWLVYKKESPWDPEVPIFKFLNRACLREWRVCNLGFSPAQ